MSKSRLLILILIGLLPAFSKKMFPLTIQVAIGNVIKTSFLPTAPIDGENNKGYPYEFHYEKPISTQQPFSFPEKAVCQPLHILYQGKHRQLQGSLEENACFYQGKDPDLGHIKARLRLIKKNQ